MGGLKKSEGLKDKTNEIIGMIDIRVEVRRGTVREGAGMLKPPKDNKEYECKLIYRKDKGKT